jgi:hypothetical protein
MVGNRRYQGLELAILAAIAAAFVVHSILLNFTQDDAYISYRYVINLTDGHGLVFNYGERVEGYTNFLWIMILALARLLSLPIIEVSKVLGVAAGAGTIVMSYFTAREFCDYKRRYLALVAPVLLAANSAFAYWAIGGLETGLFVFLCSLALFSEIKRPSATPFVLVIATLTRPEGGVLFGIVFIYRWVIQRNRLRELVGFAGVYFALLVPYAAFKLYYFGDLLPNPFYAKTGFSINYLKAGLDYCWLFFYNYGLFGILYLLPLIFLKRLPTTVKLLWLTVIVYTAYIILVGGDVLKVHRFFLPILPAIYMILAYTIYVAVAASKRRAIPWIAFGATMGLMVWSFLIPFKYIRSTGDLETRFVGKMTMVTEQLRRIDGSNFSIATTTIGKVSYTLLGHRVIDMLGLTDPHIAKNPEQIEGMKTTWKERNFNSKYLLDLKPDYILFSTGHKPSAPAERSLYLNSRFRRNYSSTGFVIAGGYKAIWKRYGDCSGPDERFPTTEFADLMYDGLNKIVEDNFAASLPFFQKAAELCNHDFPLAEAFIGQSLLRTGRTEEGIKQCEMAMQLDSNQLESRLLLLEHYKSVGNRQMADKLVKELRRIAPWMAQ